MAATVLRTVREFFEAMYDEALSAIGVKITNALPAGTNSIGTVIAKNNTDAVNATIAVGASLSGAVTIGSSSLLRFNCPAGMEGAVFTFQSAPTLAGTYQNVYDSNGLEVTVAVAAERNVVLVGDHALALAGIAYLKIRTGTSASPTAQVGADAVITIGLKG